MHLALTTAPLAALLLLAAACERAPSPEREEPAALPPVEEAEDAAGPRIALTIDDLPWVGPLPPGDDRATATGRILAALEAHGAPAVGFVNCGRVAPGAPVLRQWLEAGMPLGNHTSGHLDLNRAPVEAWMRDARTCDAELRDLTGEPSLLFRYPYLHRGPTEARYQAGRAALEELGSAVVPVSINTGDWVLDDPYVAALRAADEARAAEIADAYVEHVARATRHYVEVARQRVGRDVAHILLLHANGLLADHLGALLTRLEAEGARFITVDEALEDPVYARPDDYVGPEGLSWLYRFEPAMPEAHAWDVAELERLRGVVR